MARDDVGFRALGGQRPCGGDAGDVQRQLGVDRGTQRIGVVRGRCRRQCGRHRWDGSAARAASQVPVPPGRGRGRRPSPLGPRISGEDGAVLRPQDHLGGRPGPLGQVQSASRVMIWQSIRHGSVANAAWSARRGSGRRLRAVDDEVEVTVAVNRGDAGGELESDASAGPHVTLPRCSWRMCSTAIRARRIGASPGRSPLRARSCDGDSRSSTAAART